jgi:Holliday junction resolvase RusA-like endonuclease
MTEKGKEIKARYVSEAGSQWILSPYEGEIEVYAKIYFGTKRKCDVDNFSKIMLDSLTGIAWVDDSQIRKMTVEKFYCKENPRTEISIYMYEKK